MTLVPYETAGQVFAAASTAAWDVAFLAIDPKRATDIEFTAPYVIIEGAYMVPVTSPLQSIADIDRPGVRIAVGTGSAYEFFLTRTLQHAQLVHAPTGDDAIAQFLRDFVEEMKRSGFVGAALTRTGQHDAQVAPAAAS